MKVKKDVPPQKKGSKEKCSEDFLRKKYKKLLDNAALQSMCKKSIEYIFPWL